jgi:hypothetical protein
MNQQQRYHYQDEQDPFEVFNMFFGNAGHFEFHNGNIYRRQQHQQRRQQPAQQGYTLLLYQLIPFILFIVLYIAPILFKTVS